jgi:hypothetical protein
VKEEDGMNGETKIAEVETLAVSMAEAVKGIVVRDAETLAIANQYSNDLYEAEKRIEEFFEPLVDAANKAHKALTQKRKELVDRVRIPRSIINGEIARYAREEQERRDREAETARRKAEKEEEDRRIAWAAEAEKDGDHRAAEEILEKPVSLPPAVAFGMPPVKQELSGISTFTVWQAEVVDFPALLLAVVEGKAPEVLVMPNEKAIGNMVRTLQDKFVYPGLRAYSETRVRKTR